MPPQPETPQLEGWPAPVQEGHGQETRSHERLYPSRPDALTRTTEPAAEVEPPVRIELTTFSYHLVEGLTEVFTAVS